jgi:hypothetical protein
MDAMVPAAPAPITATRFVMAHPTYTTHRPPCVVRERQLPGSASPHSFVVMRRHRLFRGWAVLWAVLQFAQPAAVTLGDSRLERESAGGPLTHVESASGKACRPIHPANCALCQFVSHTSALADDSAAVTVVAEASPAPPPVRQARVSAVLARLSLARAPPRA